MSIFLLVRSEHPVFLVPNQVQKYAQATSIQHWQLRNSLLCPFDGDHVLFIHNSSIQQLDLRTMKKEVQLGDLNFRPASMGCQYGYVAAGGQNSQLIVRHIATNM